MKFSVRAALLLCCVLCLPGGMQAAEPVNVDVCVYGATPGGVAAAVAAAREGSKVALVEPSGLVGGMVSSGLSFSDSNQMAREALLGLFEEFYLAAEKLYHDEGIELPYKVATKDQSQWTVEPHIAEKVFHTLLKDAGVQVFVNESLQGVKKTGTRLEQLTTGQHVISAAVFIDGTYEGDLMAAAQVKYRIGREPAAQHREALAGPQYPKRVIKANPFDDDGNLLPLMTARHAPDPTVPDKGVMVYSFRLCVTDRPENRVPFPEPRAYDSRQFELVRRYLKAVPGAGQLMDFYKMPRGKLDVNNSIGGVISLGLVGGSERWPEANEAERQKIWDAHQQYTLGLIHFLKTDPAVPARLRTQLEPLGLCKDEFVQTNHWPPILYIREGRRMEGAYLMTEHDILEKITKPDSIAVGSFPIDSHDCNRIATADGTGFVNEGTIFPRRLPNRHIGQPYEIPYRSITPRPAECENLLVPVCISSTHVAMGSLRIEATWMVVGQSAGIAAHLAAQGKMPVQKVPYSQLEPRLLAQRQVLHWTPNSGSN